jgi:hypothetical protein
MDISPFDIPLSNKSVVPSHVDFLGETFTIKLNCPKAGAKSRAGVQQVDRKQSAIWIIAAEFLHAWGPGEHIRNILFKHLSLSCSF